MQPYNHTTMQPKALNIQNPRLTRDFIGNQDNVSLLDSFIRSKNIPQSLIFCGSKGVGKANLAYIFAKKILSAGKEKPVEETPSLFGDSLFGEDENNKNKVSIDEIVATKIEKNSHPDLLVIEMGSDDKKSIPIEKVKEIGKFLSLSPAESGYRVAIIDSVDDLNISSSNAILKITEEPNNKAILILISHKISSLLPTIRSRCFEIFFKIPNEKEFLEIINKFEVDYDKELAKFAGYSPGVYLDMLSEETSEIKIFARSLCEKNSITQKDISNFASLIKEDKTLKSYNNFKNIILFYSHRRLKESLGKNSKEIKNNIDNFDSIASILDIHERRNMDFGDTLKEILFKIA